jgi:hypothetical protein
VRLGAEAVVAGDRGVDSGLTVLDMIRVSA